MNGKFGVRCIRETGICIGMVVMKATVDEALIGE